MCNKFRRAATPLNLCLMPYASFFPVIPALGGTFPAPPDRCSFINRPSHRWPLRRMVFAHADLIFHHAPLSTLHSFLLPSIFYLNPSSLTSPGAMLVLAQACLNNHYIYQLLLALLRPRLHAAGPIRLPNNLDNPSLK